MEAIGNGEAGLIYRRGDLEDLARKISELIDRPIQPEAARARILKEFDWRVVSVLLDKVYESTLASHRVIQIGID
jgi:glycosyltransferase involved in cell wall biosynthesis